MQQYSNRNKFGPYLDMSELSRLASCIMYATQTLNYILFGFCFHGVGTELDNFSVTWWFDLGSAVLVYCRPTSPNK